MKIAIISRIWVMKIGTAVLAPVLFLLLMEGLLRLVGYGDPVDFFLPVAGQEDAVSANPRYAYRYFPPQLVREPDLIRMARKKPADTFRIFVLGGSAARGTPDPRFGVGRILEVMLEEAYPDRRFEVVNTAMVAINSHVVLRIARECAAYEPDIFVAYLGNNEVVGPFGAGSAFNQGVPGRGMISLLLAVRSLRTGQLIGDILQKLGGSSGPSEWRGMQMFLDHRVAAGDPRLQKVYRHFEANLSDIAGISKAADAPLLLCTVPVNLRNCSPLASEHSDGLDEAARAEWDEQYRRGVALETKERWAEAEQHYARASALDDQYAALRFRRARCELALEDRTAARAEFKAARDLDALRFRADSTINRIIRKTGQSDSVVLVDAEKRFEDLPRVRYGIPGDEVFYEHVHFTFEGNYELARMIFEETVKRLARLPAKSPPLLPRCARLLGLSGLDRFRMATSMMDLIVKPPFTEQLDYYKRCEALHARVRSLRQSRTKVGLDSAEGKLQAALAARPEALHQRVALARLYLLQHKGPAAEELLRKLLGELPDRAELQSLLGQALLIQDRVDEADAAFEKSIALAAHPPAYMVLTAEQYQQAGEIDRAKAFCRRALQAQPGATSALNRLAEIHLERRETKQALECLQRADALQPGDGKVLYKLGRAHFEAGEPEAAVVKLRAALQALPFHLGARMHLGLILKQQGQFEEAAKQLEEVVPREPRQLDLRLHLAEARLGLRQFDRAEAEYRKVLYATPDQLDAALGLAWVLAVRPSATPRERAKAVSLAERVVEATGRSAARPLDVLAAAHAAAGEFGKARNFAEQARQIARSRKDLDFARAVSDRLVLYRKNKPYRLPERK